LPDINAVLRWLEATPLSEWIIGSDSFFAFPGIIALHAIGMAFAVGINTVVNLRVLGVAPAVPLAELRRFFPLLWAGFWVNAATGVLLLIGYPTKALTNPVFYLKLALIAAAMILFARVQRIGFAARPRTTIDDQRLRRLAAASLFCWSAAITAGRLLAYTYTRLRA
jgi:hypothetical protein